jgi:protein transport protein SEC20
MKASSEVTEALRRTIGAMQGELERSVLTTQMLGVCTYVGLYFLH